jgi:hypothetical protein
MASSPLSYEEEAEDRERKKIHTTLKAALTSARRLERMAARHPEDKVLALLARHLREMLDELD